MFDLFDNDALLVVLIVVSATISLIAMAGAIFSNRRIV